MGEPPPFWDRSVIFFSNIHSIFYDNDEQAKHLLKEISGAAGYGGRVLCVLNLLYLQQPNLILLDRPGTTKEILPFNLNTNAEGKVGKGQFFCLGQTYEDCGDLFAQAWSQLPVEWGYARD